MNAILLAAGTGSRLGGRTEQLPKALVSIDGRPLVDYALGFLRESGFANVIVVTGFQMDLVRQHLKHRRNVTIRENPEYLKGNLLSLLAAQADFDNGFAIFNVDHIYPKTMAPSIRSIDGLVTALCDFDRLLTADDMKVSTERKKRIRAISKTLSVYDAGYIGCTVVPKSAVEVYLVAVQNVQETVGQSAVVEHVLSELAKTEFAPAISDTSGIRWLEVDDERDYRRAEEALRSPHEIQVA